MGSALLWVRPLASLPIPRCPVAAYLHLDCPGCGTTRALAALVHGDVASALDHNVLALTALPVIVASFIWWVMPRWKPAWVTRIASSPIVPKLVLAFVVVFTVVRNTNAVGGYLGAG